MSQHMAPLMGLVWLALVAIVVVVIAGQWKAFKKAGEPGWAAIIPFYNIWVMVRISDNPAWWFVMFYLPFANIVAFFKIPIDIAKKFGQGLGFGLGLAVLSFIFWPLLGFGDYTYEGGEGVKA